MTTSNNTNDIPPYTLLQGHLADAGIWLENALRAQSVHKPGEDTIAVAYATMGQAYATLALVEAQREANAHAAAANLMRLQDQLVMSLAEIGTAPEMREPREKVLQMVVFYRTGIEGYIHQYFPGAPDFSTPAR